MAQGFTNVCTQQLLKTETWEDQAQVFDFIKTGRIFRLGSEDPGIQPYFELGTPYFQKWDGSTCQPQLNLSHPWGKRQMSFLSRARGRNEQKQPTDSLLTFWFVTPPPSPGVFQRWIRPTRGRCFQNLRSSLGNKPDHPKGQKSAALNRNSLSFTETSASPSKTTPATCNIPAQPEWSPPDAACPPQHTLHLSKQTRGVFV